MSCQDGTRETTRTNIPCSVHWCYIYRTCMHCHAPAACNNGYHLYTPWNTTTGLTRKSKSDTATFRDGYPKPPRESLSRQEICHLCSKNDAGAAATDSSMWPEPRQVVCRVHLPHQVPTASFRHKTSLLRLLLLHISLTNPVYWAAQMDTICIAEQIQ